MRAHILQSYYCILYVGVWACTCVSVSAICVSSYVVLLQRLAEKEELELHASPAICVSSYYIRVSSSSYMVQHHASGRECGRTSAAACVFR
jgi:hypothetical protein